MWTCRIQQNIQKQEIYYQVKTTQNLIKLLKKIFSPDIPDDDYKVKKNSNNLDDYKGIDFTINGITFSKKINRI